MSEMNDDCRQASSNGTGRNDKFQNDLTVGNRASLQLLRVANGNAGDDASQVHTMRSYYVQYAISPLSPLSLFPSYQDVTKRQ